ncbi:MAG: 3-hydroxyacyl-CoA dehydrogenase NAD-binding domain-containing protein, partial [Pyrinomonadaceae bacterium]|nr:3-hydroxyacyl-CoA dehydrogenase NAD-binding domain-containing protein [Pyrinomonadaceae bacterium]
ARGFDVIAIDPAPNAELNLRKYIDEAWPALTDIGLSSGASRHRLGFTTNMKEALSQADFVQENGPERADFKIKLFADMDAATPPDSLIASSSSGITASVMQSQCKHPERIVIGHPFNPPHIVPLVEVVGGTRTSPEAVQEAIAFYASIGKKPIHLHKELPGHVGNRLQAALYKEVMYLIQQGVLSVSDADDAVSYGPGLRWGGDIVQSFFFSPNKTEPFIMGCRSGGPGTHRDEPILRRKTTGVGANGSCPEAGTWLDVRHAVEPSWESGRWQRPAESQRRLYPAVFDLRDKRRMDLWRQHRINIQLDWQ